MVIALLRFLTKDIENIYIYPISSSYNHMNSGSRLFGYFPASSRGVKKGWELYVLSEPI